MKLSLVVPCYNEEGNIKLFTDTIEKTFKDSIYDYEIIFINDGSKDNTMDKLRQIAKENTQNIKIINFSRNFGKESGIYAGLKNSKGDYVCIIDADLQQRPEYVKKMVEILDNHPEYDSVVAYQDQRKEGGFLTFCKDTFYRLINKMSEIEFVRGASDFRTLRRGMVDAILEMQEYYRFSKGIFSWVGFNNYYMPYDVEDRNAGTTKWSFWKLFKYAIEGIVSFTTVPLRLATITGIIVSLLSLVYLIIVVVQKLFFFIEIPGYATIVTLILLLGGLQLLCIGIIGEYLARTYVETKKRPIYIAREIIDNKEQTHDKKNKKSI